MAAASRSNSSERQNRPLNLHHMASPSLSTSIRPLHPYHFPNPALPSSRPPEGFVPFLRSSRSSLVSHPSVKQKLGDALLSKNTRVTPRVYHAHAAALGYH